MRRKDIAQHFLLKGSAHASHSLCSVCTWFLGIKSHSVPDVGALKQETGVSGCAKACCLTRQGSQSMPFIRASQGKKGAMQVPRAWSSPNRGLRVQRSSSMPRVVISDLAPDQSHLYKQGARKDSRSYLIRCALQPSELELRAGVRKDKPQWGKETWKPCSLTSAQGLEVLQRQDIKSHQIYWMRTPSPYPDPCIPHSLPAHKC